jgi:hypothetical protein
MIPLILIKKIINKKKILHLFNRIILKNLLMTKMKTGKTNKICFHLNIIIINIILVVVKIIIILLIIKRLEQRLQLKIIDKQIAIRLII